MVEWLFNMLVETGDMTGSATLSRPWSVLQCLQCFLARKPEAPSVEEGDTLAKEIAGVILQQGDFACMRRVGDWGGVWAETF